MNQKKLHFVYYIFFFILLNCDLKSKHDYTFTSLEKIPVTNLLDSTYQSSLEFFQSKKVDSVLYYSRYHLITNDKKYFLDVFKFKKGSKVKISKLKESSSSESLKGVYSLEKNRHFIYNFNEDIDYKKSIDSIILKSSHTIKYHRTLSVFEADSDKLKVNFKNNLFFFTENKSSFNSCKIILKFVSEEDCLKIYVLTPEDINDELITLKSCLAISNK